MTILDQVYETGTVSVASGSKVISGSGTAWELALIEGGLIEIDGSGLGAVRIASISGDGDGLLKFDWPGSDLIGASYTIFRETAQAADAIEANAYLVDISRRLHAHSFLEADATGTLAQRASWNGEAQDFVYIQTDVSPARLFFKKSATSGDWSGYTELQGPEGPPGPRGVNWQGAWDSGSTYVINDLVSDDDADDDPAAWIALTVNSNSRPRDNADDWAYFPGSFPARRDYGLITESAATTRDYGSIV